MSKSTSDEGEGGDALIHLRVPAATKARWVRESRAAGMRLTDWIVERVERQETQMIVYYAYIQHPRIENKIASLGHIEARDEDHARAIAWSQNREICERLTKKGGTLEVDAQGGSSESGGVRYVPESLTGH